MVAKIIVIVGLSVSVVVGMFVIGRFLDAGHDEEPSVKKD